MIRLPAVLLALLFAVAAPGCGRDQEPQPQAKSATAAPQAALIDINRAGKHELMSLKGIGEVRAQAIIRERPYARKDELVQKGIVPLSVYDDIKDRIIARQK